MLVVSCGTLISVLSLLDTTVLHPKPAYTLPLANHYLRILLFTKAPYHIMIDRLTMLVVAVPP